MNVINRHHPSVTDQAEISLITPDRLVNLGNAALLTQDVKGDMAELGVYRGGSARLLSDLFPERELLLFDTFTGLPHTEDTEYANGHDLEKGRFSVDPTEVIQRLNGRRIYYCLGRFPEQTGNIAYQRTFAFVHVDCDLYQSAVDAINIFWPRVEMGGIMFFDDYNAAFTGVTKAVQERFHPNKIIERYDAEFSIFLGAYVVKQ